MHAFVRSSPAYVTAVEAYQRENSLGVDSDIGYCYLCSTRISYGNGAWHYRFSLVDARSGEKIRAHVRSPAADGSTVTFN